MNRFLITTFLLIAAQPAAQPAAKKAPAPAAPVEAPAPIPFAPLGPPPFGDPAPPAAIPAASGAVTVYFEEGTLRFLVFDDRGWLPDAKQLQISVSVGARSLELVSYPGPYAPTAPEVRKCDLAKALTVSPAEFQAKLDEATRGVTQQNGVASR